MRTIGLATVLALTLVTGGVSSQIAMADDGTSTPSQQDVRNAKDAVAAKATDVDGVRAQLALANQRLQDSAIAAQQAAEAYNGARYHLQQARAAARVAAKKSTIAERAVARQRDAYAGAIVTSYELAPGLTALSAMSQSDGIETVLDQAATMRNAEDALDGQYDEFRATATLAGVASDQAGAARAEADQAENDARAARDDAQAAADSAAADAQSIAAEKSALIADLAKLQNISVSLAEQRQSALEEQAAAAAAAAAQHEQELLQQQQQQQEEQQNQAPESTPGPDHNPTPNPTPTPPTPTPNPPPPPPPPPTPTPDPPAPSGGASAAIAFAKAQLGEPYRWGASGPSAWDCSGLTMGAWAAGGRSLPHYSVAQYQQSTPISAGSLQPGDLVFWGSTSNPSSIYHVALYVGGGQIIHAPRTGRDVSLESLYYWIPPNFYARP
ncbi:C40 family peptidase [Nocardioides sp.]|uniref:C40 family peptidase n=1 Tax=Nocardioides sp. TaxID=35761 RepID=UPI0031FE7BAA|nr:NlpC/P60 family protein [Nocardioides sp.]